MKSTRKEYLPVILLSLVFVVLSFLLQHKWCPSMLTQTDTIWDGRLEIRMSEYPFSMRYFTNYSTYLIHHVTSLSILHAFQVVQFTLLFLLGPALYYFLKTIKFGHSTALIGIVLFYLSYPIASAFVQPVFTWDDFWVYLFLALSIGFVIRAGAVAGGLFFMLALLAREQTVIYWPIYALGVWGFCKNRSVRERIVYIVLPLALYFPFFLGHYGQKPPRPIENFLFNFENKLRISDTIYSILVSFGFIWPAAAVAMIRRWPKKYDIIGRFLVQGALYAVPITFVAVLFMGRARETRLFFPLFIVLIPLALFYLQGIYRDICTLPARAKKIILVISFVPMMWLGITCGQLLFPAFEFRVCPNAAQLWIGVNFGLILCMAEIYLIKKIRKGSESRLQSMQSR